MKGSLEICIERDRQESIEGWHPSHDDEHNCGELVHAAASYLGYADWPWDSEFDKRKKHSRRRKLIIAGALIAAEIDRLDRQ